MCIITAIHDKLNLWRHLIALIADPPTHLQEIRPDKQMWIGATDASLEGVGGICLSPTGEWNFWRLAVDSTASSQMTTPVGI